MLRLTSLAIAGFVLICPATSREAQLQSWREQPSYTEVNPGGTKVLRCLVDRKRGECRWTKNGQPAGIFHGKYEWAGEPKEGDCSLRVMNANLEHDNAIWQCSVSPTSFDTSDALTSEEAQLVVREKPREITLHKIGDVAEHGGKIITARAGEEIELSCNVRGGNPPSQIKWFSGRQQILTGYQQVNENEKGNGKQTWLSVSRLKLPVSKIDNKAKIECSAEHPTLDNPLVIAKQLNIHYPPTVKIVTSSNVDGLEDKKDSVTLKCEADANPPATVVWRKKGLMGVYGPHAVIEISPVSITQHGTLTCEASNAIGQSEVASIDLNILYAPIISNVGPSKVIRANLGGEAILTCNGTANPSPHFQWLQKLPTQEVLIRGNDRSLKISDISYKHQGEFVCKATNMINGEKRDVQSEPIVIQVQGRPQFSSIAKKEVTAGFGEDTTLEVAFCSNPAPKLQWHLGGHTNTKNVLLAAGTAHGRFIAEEVQPSANKMPDCYEAVLRIRGVHADDSHGYKVKVKNAFGSVSHVVFLNVKEQLPQESIIIAVSVGAVLAFLVLILILIYCCRPERCCCRRPSQPKKDFKSSDLESDRIDLESTNSSSVSTATPSPRSNIYTGPNSKLQFHLAGPCDFITPNNPSFADKHVDIDDSRGFIIMDESQESLNRNFPVFNHVTLEVPNTRHYTTTERQNYLVGPPRIVYNDLANFPKTSNYGSMKQSKNNHL